MSSALPDRRRAVPLAAALSLALGACAPFPEVTAPGAESARNQPYPQLVPITEVLDRAVLLPKDAPPVDLTLEARAGMLRARADALRAPILTASDRQRMREAVARLDARRRDVVKTAALR